MYLGAGAVRLINEGGLEVIARLAQKESTDTDTRVDLARTIFNLSRHGMSDVYFLFRHGIVLISNAKLQRYSFFT